MSKVCCPNCGSTSIVNEEASGNSICTACGIIVEENNIVSSVEFMEGAGGSSSMVGSFVSATGRAKSSAGGPGGGGPNRYGFSRDSRETTLANGKRRIQDVASRLRLANHFIETAHRFFSHAVENNFVQGRRTTHVVAACLYIACRQEKSNHMLIDFSDALQVNVYTLGTCFLKFRRMLAIQLEIIDPALYIYRFAAHLDLEDKARAVALTALRLVGRMKRDWIVCGRRPAGICAAALLIAARAHGFTRENQDVTKVLRVCGMTVQTRVKEFEHTPSANLSLEQFMTLEVQSEADPPRYTSNRIREARALAIQENNVELLKSGKLDDPRMGKGRQGKWRAGLNDNNDDNLLSNIGKRKNIGNGKGGGGQSKRQKELKKMYGDIESEMCNQKDGGTIDVEDDDKDEDVGDNDEDVQNTSSAKSNTTTTTTTAQQLIARQTSDLIQYPLGNNKKPLVLPNQATAEELQKSIQPEEDKIDLDSWKQSMPSSQIDELDSLFRTDEEIQQKEAIFNKMNQDYNEKQKRKEKEQKEAELAQKEKDDLDAAQKEDQARYLNKQKMMKRKRVSFEGGDDEDAEPTTEEALLAALSARKISRKINYDAMSTIFDDTGSFSTDLLEDHEPEKNFQEETFEMV